MTPSSRLSDTRLPTHVFKPRHIRSTLHTNVLRSRLLSSMSPLQLAADHLSRVDSVLAPIIRSSDLPSLVAHTNYYQELVESIIGQQLSVKAAATIRSRFVALFDDIFPTPEQIIASDIEQLRSVGLSRPKARYIKDLAMRILDGNLRLDTLDTLSNDEIIKELTAVKGVGEWTAPMFL